MTTTSPSPVIASTRGALTPRAMDVALGTETRPSWRGRLHLLTLVGITPVLVLLVLAVEDPRTRAGAVVYAVGLCAMFAVSTTYHRWVHTLRARAIWRRADHATIFVAIAATCTPLCLEVTPSGSGWRLLAFWTIAGAGVVAKATGGRRAHRVADAMYIANGWAGVLVLVPLWRDGEVLATALLAGGGLVYTVGAVAFAVRRPALRPAVFGYHEVWHAATIAAAVAHLAAIWILIA